MKASLTKRIAFFQRFDSRKNDFIRQYNQNHREGIGLNITIHDNWLSEAARTGEVFPGRPEVRPRVEFGSSSRTENLRSCKKGYKASNTFSPGIFTVQCVCTNPKIIGVSVMMECEGISTALSILLSRFKILPRICYYDNACNMSRSIILRLPWINNTCTVVCDRFHYKGHICNSVWDPDSHPSCRIHASSAAESINRLWSLSKSHLRYLDSRNLMAFLAMRSVFINVRSMIRAKEKKTDINENLFREYVRNMWECPCIRCKRLVIEDGGTP